MGLCRMQRCRHFAHLVSPMSLVENDHVKVSTKRFSHSRQILKTEFSKIQGVSLTSDIPSMLCRVSKLSLTPANRRTWLQWLQCSPARAHPPSLLRRPRQAPRLGACSAAWDSAGGRIGSVARADGLVDTSALWCARVCRRRDQPNMSWPGHPRVRPPRPQTGATGPVSESPSRSWLELSGPGPIRQRLP